MQLKGSRLSSQQTRQLIDCFVLGATARAVAELTGLNRKTVTLFYHKLRIIIKEALAQESFAVRGEIEVDESYFGGVRKGKRGRGAAGKVPVFGLLKRGGKVHTVMVQDTTSKTLIPLIEERVRPDSIVYSDSYRSYDILDVSDFKHYRINHSKLFAHKTNHINGIENFWNQAKRHLRKYNGIPKPHFELFLKECEWRFNYRPVDRQKSALRKWLVPYIKK